MPQVFQVLKCYKCSVFQIHQTKKSNKFQCKMCGEKQSIKRHYGLGNGAECRMHVQKLNLLRGEKDESKQNTISDDCISSSEDENEVPIKSTLASQVKNDSKWSDFIDDKEHKDSLPISNEAMYFNNTEVVLELPRKRQKPLGRYTKNRNNKNKKTNSDNSDSENANDNCKSEIETSADILQNYESSSNKIKRWQPPNIIKKENSISNICSSSSTSKWSQSASESGNTMNLNHRSANILQCEERKQKYVPPLINRDSKWAKFAEDENNDNTDIEEAGVIEENNVFMPNENNYLDLHNKHSLDQSSETNYQDSQFNNKYEKAKSNFHVDHTSKNAPNILFSLCDDDNEIDDYLAI